MSEYTIPIIFQPALNDSTIQIILDANIVTASVQAAVNGYVASLQLPSTQTQHLLWANIGCSIFVEQLLANYYLPSLGIQTPMAAIKANSSLADKVAEIQSLNGAYPKCQFLLWMRNDPTAAWVWCGTDVIQNYGNRVNFLNLLTPYLTQNAVALIGKTTQIGIQFIVDPVSKATLPQVGDRLVIQGSARVETSLLDGKKNYETEALKTRLTALENLLGIMGPATPTIAGRNGLVPAAPVGGQSQLLKGDGSWQDPVGLPVSAAATTAINSAVTNLIASSPTTLDTLNELAAALGNDPNFATTVTNLIGSKVGKTGDETIGGIKTFSNTTQSTLPSNGGTVFLGGVGVIGDLNIGGLVKSNNKIIVQNTVPLNINANTWFTVGTANNIGIVGVGNFYIVGLYIQYGDGSVTYPHWQWCGAGTIGVIYWKAAGSQTITTFRVETHNGNDVICSLRLGMGSSNSRVVQIMFDTAIITLAPSILAVTFFRQA